MNCHNLEYIEIPSTVDSVGSFAFANCSSISHITVPTSVKPLPSLHFFNIRSVGNSDIGISKCAFSGCNSLISIELPEAIVVDIELSRCFSLVNLSGPRRIHFEHQDTFWNRSKFGSVINGYDNFAWRLNHRFDSSPLNKLCYCQSYHSSEDAMAQLRSLIKDDPLAATNQVDEFGMTPLHVISLSQTPNLDMLLTLMNEGNSDHVVCSRDSFGSTPMDYLCLNRMPDSTQVIRRVLQTRFNQMLDLDRSWRSDTLQAVEDALAVDWSSRRREVYAIYLKLAVYERKEIISLVELYLWKLELDDSRRKKKEEEIADRQRCRILSGATTVIPHLLLFLGKLDMEDYYFATMGAEKGGPSSQYEAFPHLTPADEEDWI
eukprot:scaffold1356_cov123-Cylindrotheca_fusiformis.AAC.33